MNRRSRQKHERHEQARARLGTDPVPAETKTALAAALASSTGEDACRHRPGIWRPVVPETVNPVIRAEDPGDAPWYDPDVVALHVEMAGARNGLDAWMESRRLFLEEAEALEALETEIAKELETGEDERDEDHEPEEIAGVGDRLREIATDAAFMREWESCEPLTAGIASLPLRHLADAVGIGPIVALIASGESALDAFEARHTRAKALIGQIDRTLAEESVAPEALVAAALEKRVSAALDQVLTAEALRIPQEIRRVVVEFRQARDGRGTPLRAFLDANADLNRAYILLDQHETAVRSGGTRAATRDVRHYGETIEICEAGFRELARIERELARIEETLDQYRSAFLALCDRARTAVNAVAQVRAAVQMLKIPLSDAMSGQLENETRRLCDAVDTYTAEMDAEFEAPPRNPSVRRLETELPERRSFYASLTRPRAESFFAAPVADRDDEMRRLILLTYDATCNSGRVKGRSVRAVTGSIMVRAGFIRAEESDRARDLFSSKEATEWRKTHFDHYTVGSRGHIYAPNTNGRALARTHFHDLANSVDFMERVLRALLEHRADAAREEESKKAAKA